MKNYIFWGVVTIALGFSVPFGAVKIADTIFYDALNSKKEVVVFERLENNQAIILNSAASLKRAVLLFVGDIMLDRGVKNSVIKNGNGDFSFIFQNAPFIKNADIVFANLEGPVSDRGKNVGSEFSFRFNPLVLNSLKDAGFNVFSIANNHIADWGKEAFEDTINNLENGGFLAVGGGMNKNEAEQVKIIEKNGMTFGFLGFSDIGPKWFEAKENSSGILLAKEDGMKDVVNRASQMVDVLIVSFHFGNEYEKNASERQKLLAHLAIDNGAKIVVGHHPHVVQEVESYNNGVIAYSLGNFVFDQDFSEETAKGLILEILTEEGKIKSVNRREIKINEFFQPEPVE